MPPLPVTKAHAYGNDFLFVPVSEAGAGLPDLAKRLCHRHHGIGADGLIAFDRRSSGATMRLFNADGSASELSGNGLRCLAALVARAQSLAVGTTVVIETGAGAKQLELVRREGERYTFRAAMGAPEDLRQVELPVAGEHRAGDGAPHGKPAVHRPRSAARCTRGFIASARCCPRTPRFPAGTNVEFAHVEAPDRVRILIWERGVGPTTSSGTGSSASAVAAAAHGGAAREVDVIAPGGTQRVEWRE